MTKGKWDIMYDEIAKFVKLISAKDGRYELVKYMETCGKMWLKWQNKKLIVEDECNDVFKILSYVLDSIDRNSQQMNDNPRVEYLQTFVIDTAEAVKVYEDREDSSWLFVHVKSLIDAYEPPNDLDTQFPYLGTFQISGQAFEKVYTDIVKLVKWAGEKYDVDTLVDLLNGCHKTWTTATKLHKITQTAASGLFQNLNTLLVNLQTIPQLLDNKHVLYLLEFVKYISKKISGSVINKNEYVMFQYVKSHIAAYGYNPPPSNLETTHAEATPVVADLKPHAELTGGSVRVAGLLCELNALRA